MAVRRTVLRSSQDGARFALYARAHRWSQHAEATGDDGEVSAGLWFTPRGLRVELVDEPALDVPVVVTESMVDSPESAAEWDVLASEIESLFQPVSAAEAVRLYRSATGDRQRVLFLPLVAITAPTDPGPDREAAYQAIAEALTDEQAGVRMAAAVAIRYLALPEFASALRRLIEQDPDEDVRRIAGGTLILLPAESGSGAGPEAETPEAATPEAATPEDAGPEDAGSADEPEEVRITLLHRPSAADVGNYAAGQGWEELEPGEWRTGAGVSVRFTADETVERDLLLLSGGGGGAVARVASGIRATFPTVATRHALAYLQRSDTESDRARAVQVLAATAPLRYEPDVYVAFLAVLRDPVPELRALTAGLVSYPAWAEFGPVLDWLATADPDPEVREMAGAGLTAIHRFSGDDQPPEVTYYSTAQPPVRVLRRIAVGPEPVDEELAGGVWRTTEVTADPGLVVISQDEAQRLAVGE
ncbi:HEAT repeat domain-containing protein [Rugosimonospora africana]|uniref:HEAT repeat-containing protein n=1 Tax=Rugosimonospora africana TaxID=556532 RepID=A0A8J3VUL1_9ACTN|nr:HEAT repeat domain-containing protein [Rugosimonospora africana]GIH18851.1 hypothetical protein Raf01_70230 [Rugosimonospora africana]